MIDKGKTNDNSSKGRSTLTSIPRNNTKAYSFDMISIEPQRFDILCGKDKTCIKHEGRHYFRKVIEAYHERYQNCTTKQEKMNVTKEIFEHLQRSSGSRFLKFDEKTKSWQEINQIAARDKISHALRFASQKQERKQQQKEKKSKESKHPLKRASSEVSPSLPYDSHSLTASTTTKPTETNKTGEEKTVTTVSSSAGTIRKKEAIKMSMKGGGKLRTHRRSSDPSPLRNQEDEQVWNTFVKRQEQLLKSIRNGELSPSTLVEIKSKKLEHNETQLPVVEMCDIDVATEVMLKEPLLDMDGCCGIELDWEESCSIAIDKSCFP